MIVGVGVASVLWVEDFVVVVSFGNGNGGSIALGEM